MKFIKITALALIAAALGACAHKNNPPPMAPTGGGVVYPAK